MQDTVRVQRALMSLSDKKSYLAELLTGLNAGSVDILSSGGTYNTIREMGHIAREVSAYTGFPESPGGLVKTLHPAVHGGIILDADKPDHAAYMRTNGIVPIQLVAVNFYPFRQMALEGKDLETLRAHGIDIGGPTMVRSAAMSFPHTAVITDRKSYEMAADEINATGTTSFPTRFRLARHAFALLATYDGEIEAHLNTLDPQYVASVYERLGIRDPLHVERILQVREGVPRSPGGLLDTIDPRIYGGILLNHDLPEHSTYMDTNGIQPINAVVHDFNTFHYPIKDKPMRDVIDGIGVDDLPLVRAAAKSFPHMAVAADHGSTSNLEREHASEGFVSLSTRFELARNAFELVARRSRLIADYFNALKPEDLERYNGE